MLRRYTFPVTVMVLCLLIAGYASNTSATRLESGTETPTRAAASTATPTAPPPLPSLPFDPTQGKYYAEVNQTFALNVDEIALLRKNGFVASDRLAYQDFTTAYAYIYKHDLPVFVTTDSILQAVHQTYSDLTVRLETHIFRPKLRNMLASLWQYSQMAPPQDPDLLSLYADLQTYLAVPLTLLSKPFPELTYLTPTPQPTPVFESRVVDDYLARINAASTVEDISLFGTSYSMDYTQFKPRGHYAQDDLLGDYFRAMMWLSRVEFRFVDYDLTGQPKLNPGQIAGAALLRDMLNRTGGSLAWAELDDLLQAFVGKSDNMTLPDLEQFLADAGLDSPKAVLHPSDPDRLLKLLTTKDYGAQRITGGPLAGSPGGAPTARPISFMLMGQRYTLDSDIMGNLIFDRLVVNGQKVQRPQPSPLDLMYALGDDQALAHLGPQLAKYGYQQNLEAQRSRVDQYDSAFWAQNMYNRWFAMLRTLDTPTTAAAYPSAMRTTAWTDKALHTQLASWAQLRHDNVLYAKPNYVVSALCEYPAGYVEPYPAFYAAVRSYARFGLALFENMNPAGLDTYQGPDGLTGEAIRQQIIAYYGELDLVAAQLGVLAEKELRLEPFTPEEEGFLKEVVIQRFYEENLGCTVVTKEDWNGWYLRLMPWRDASPALIADINSNLNNDPSFPDLLPPAVLHVATGAAATTIFGVDTDQGVMLYVGPSFTYYEVLKEGYPPVRLTDVDWQKQLAENPPPPPDWTQSFRVPATRPVQYLTLPTPSPDQ